MFHALIVMTPSRRCEHLVSKALAAVEAAEEGRVTLVWLVDHDRREHLRECLENRGFVAAGPARDMDRLMVETSQTEGQHRLRELKAEAVGRGLAVETEVLNGPLEQSILALCERLEPDQVYLPVRNVSPFSYWFGLRRLKRLHRRLGDALITR